MAEVESLSWWAEDLDDVERGRRAVKSQQLICNLPSEGYRRDMDIRNIRLYENNPVISLYSFAGKYYGEGASTLALPPPEQSVNNKAKAAIDTFAAQVFSTNQRARFVSVDADYRQRRRARELQAFGDGLAQEIKLHRLKQRAGLDAAILESGVGAIQFFRKDGRCAAQRVLATELTIDPYDGLVDGQPRTLYRRRPMPRDQVLALYGEDEAAKKAIEAAPMVAAGGAPGDNIEVYEQWHLPTSEKAKDGYHITGLDIVDGVLQVEPHEKPFHEIVFFSIEDRFTTGWGLSLMTQARPLQTRINANMYRIERAQKLFHAGHLYVNRLSKVNKSALSNEIGSVWEGNGDTPPQKISFDCASPELYKQVEVDGQRIFENLGISVAASQGETNAGLNASAAAKREDTAKSDKRNAVRQQRWEQFHLDCMRVALSVVRDIVGKGGGKYTVAAPGKRGLTVVDWAKAAMDEKDYALEVRAASPIPTEPAGLMALGERMVEIGAWKPRQLAGYMQDLDADGRTNRQLSQERGLEKVFEKLLYDKTAAAMPDEFTNLELALEIGTEYLAQGLEDGVPEKHLERVRRYLRRCKKLGSAAQAMNAAPPVPPGPPAAAAPVPPPGAGPIAQ